MNRTIESPFLDRELFERESYIDPGSRIEPAAETSPLADTFSTEPDLAESEDFAWQDEYSEEAESEDFTPWQEKYSEEAGGLIGDETEVDEGVSEYTDQDPSAAELAAVNDFEDADTASNEYESFDPASNEYEPFDPASNEYEAAVDFAEAEFRGDVDAWAEVRADVDASAPELDGELFQRLVPLNPVVEQAVVAAQIASGKRDVNELTNVVFFLRHPSLKGTRLAKGQEPLMAEWLQIRDGIVKPALARITPRPGEGAALPVDTTNVPLGTLTCNVPGRQPFTYSFTPDDLLWTARFINGEAGGRDDAENRSVIWAMFNRYAFFRNDVPSWGSFSDFVRKYSTPLQPYLKSYTSVKDWVAKCNSTFDNPGCNYQPTTSDLYPGTNIRKGQLKTFLKLQQTPWSSLKESSRRLATQALSGQIDNPIGNASEFADTAVYFKRKHGTKPTRAEWEAYTRGFAASKGWLWRPGSAPYDEFGHNVLFINGKAKNFPPNATNLVRAGSPAATIPTPTPTPTTKPTTVGPTGDPDRESLYDGSTPAPGTVETRRSYPTNPPITGTASNRTRMRYDNVINQFAVGVNPRYAHRINKKGKTSTYCNIFLWDVTRAMGCEIPHWVNSAGEPGEVGKGNNEMNANATHDWLHKHSSRYGWRRLTDPAEAQALANGGHPAVLSYKKAGGIGHVAVIRPGEIADKGNPMAQAGARNVNQTHVYSIFRRGTAIVLWGHD